MLDEYDGLTIAFSDTYLAPSRIYGEIAFEWAEQER